MNIIYLVFIYIYMFQTKYVKLKEFNYSSDK